MAHIGVENENVVDFLKGFLTSLECCDGRAKNGCSGMFASAAN